MPDDGIGKTHYYGDDCDPPHVPGIAAQISDALFDLDPRWPRLLAAARAWKANLIPKTSTGVAGPTNALIKAIEAFDEESPA